MLNDLEIEKAIGEMPDRKLLEFTARQVCAIHAIALDHEKRITGLETHDKKLFGAVGGISGLIGAGIVAAINYFTGQHP